MNSNPSRSSARRCILATAAAARHWPHRAILYKVQPPFGVQQVRGGVLIVNGRALTENVAINTYIARTYPAAKLLPSNSIDELEAISLMGWFSGGIHRIDQQFRASGCFRRRLNALDRESAV
jgi:hypothetical protein